MTFLLLYNSQPNFTQPLGISIITILRPSFHGIVVIRANGKAAAFNDWNYGSENGSRLFNFPFINVILKFQVIKWKLVSRQLLAVHCWQQTNNYESDVRILFSLHIPRLPRCYFYRVWFITIISPLARPLLVRSKVFYH